MSEMPPTIRIITSDDGHVVEWVKGGVTEFLGPYIDVKMAERVRDTKLRELVENAGPNPYAERPV